jgi:hypothetical protein
MKYAFAKWKLKSLPEDLNDFHISQGEDDDSQGIGYFIDDKGASLTINHKNGFYYVELRAPSCGLEKHKEYWLSPSCPTDDEIEAHDFGIKEFKKPVPKKVNKEKN